MAEETSISSVGIAAVSMGVAIIIAVVMIIVVQTIQDDITKDTTESLASNLSLTWAGNNTAISIAPGRIVNGSEKLYNNGTVVGLGNYTLDVNGAITIVNQTGADGTTNGSWVTDTLNLSYQFLLSTAAKNVSIDGLAAQNTFVSFFPLIALALVGMIVIGIVLKFFISSPRE